MSGSCSSHGRDRNAYTIVVGKPEGKRLLGRLGVDGRLLLKWILDKQVVMIRTELICLRIGTSGGLL
jgi:hypothetical protein